MFLLHGQSHGHTTGINKMAVCGQSTIRINKFRDYNEDFTFTDCDGAPRDLTGYEFTLQIRATKNALDPELLELTSNPAAGIIIQTPATNGIIEVTITKAQSELLPIGVFPFDLYLVDASGNTETAISGHMTIQQSTAR